MAISAASDTRLLMLPVTVTTGVWPRRPQVRLTPLAPWHSAPSPPTSRTGASARANVSDGPIDSPRGIGDRRGVTSGRQGTSVTLGYSESGRQPMVVAVSGARVGSAGPVKGFRKPAEIAQLRDTEANPHRETEKRTLVGLALRGEFGHPVCWMLALSIMPLRTT